jgi:hypothetical protein
MFTILAALLFALGCGGSSTPASTAGGNTITPTAANVATITVNQGPGEANGYSYINGAFASATICAAGSTTNCGTVDGLLVDTGSTGVRILSSALAAANVTLTPQTDSLSNPVAECYEFVDSYVWGPVATADVTIAGEKASSLPVQVLDDSTYTAPSQCTSGGLSSADTLATLNANGVLGVGSYSLDCGDVCSEVGYSTDANPFPVQYYGCPSASTCQIITESDSLQVQNPVSLFATDNNGVIVELPAVSSPQASISGSLVFGIGTESNNALGTATVFTLNSSGEYAGYFTTNFDSQSNPQSFLDSGSNGLYFADAGLESNDACTTNVDFYCPPTPLTNQTATNVGANAASNTVSFGIVNADQVFSADPDDAVFNNLAGIGSSGSFDWGLPFFYGRNVFTSIDGATTPAGASAFWAY